jgi:transposase InsO family protein
LRGEESITELCRKEGINQNLYYRWSKEFLEAGKKRLSGDTAREATTDEVKDLRREMASLKEVVAELLMENRLPALRQAAVVDLALAEPELSPRELAVKYTDEQAYFVSEATVYRLLKAQDLITRPAYVLMQASDKFQQPTTAVNQMWQTDFTYLKVLGWGWYYLSTVLDDYSRFIVAWRLCTTMSARDVADTLDEALAFTGLDQVQVKHRPRLLSDNGPSYVAGELRTYLEAQDMAHTRGRPYHPMTQGKIERWHRSLKNQVLLEHYYLPGDLEQRISAFVGFYNYERYHESLHNLTPADVFYGRGQQILERRERIKRKTLAMRKAMHYGNNSQSHLMS